MINEPVDLERLMKYSGFPKPFLSDDPVESDRWRMQFFYALNDYLGKPCSLNYLRTKDKAGIDFCIAGKHSPKMMIEATLSEETPGKSIINFNRRCGIPGIRLVMKLKQERKENNVEFLLKIQ